MNVHAAVGYRHHAVQRVEALLRDRGFEVTWHGATMEPSDRARTEAGDTFSVAGVGDGDRVVLLARRGGYGCEVIGFGSTAVTTPHSRA